MSENFFNEITNKKLISNWKTLFSQSQDQFIYKIQHKIYKAALEGEVEIMTYYQKILLNSFNAKILALNKALKKNCLSLKLIQQIKIATLIRVYNSQDLYFFWKKLRISISYEQFFEIYHDTLIYLFTLILIPQWEAYLEPGILGYRINFSHKDIVINLCKEIQHNYYNNLLHGELKIIDHVNHTQLLNYKLHNSKVISYLVNFYLYKKIYLLHPKKYFHRGYGIFYNILTYGIQYTLIENNVLQKYDNINHNYLTYYLSYEKYFCILCKKQDSLQWIDKKLKQNFFTIGFDFTSEKIPIYNYFNFNFLNFNFNVQSNRIYIQPTLYSKKELIFQIRKILYKKDFVGRTRALTHLSMENILKKINPIIGCWFAHYNISTNIQDFKLLDKIIDNTLYRWQIKKYKKNVVISWKKQCIKYVRNYKRISEGKEILELLFLLYKTRKLDGVSLSHRSIYDLDKDYWNYK